MKGFPVAILFILLLTACNKEKNTPTPVPEEEYGFKATIGENKVNIKYADQDQRVTAQNGFIDQVRTYGIIVDFRKAYNHDSMKAVLAFELYDLEKRVYKIERQESYAELKKNKITFTYNPNTLNSETVVYAPNPNKKAFKISVTDIEYHDHSLIPTVSGNLEGVLYNVKNEQDSLVIKNAVFKFRY